MRKCSHAGDNHSTDLVEVYFGEVAPKILCGYHAQVWLSR
jgi:hypothetical protein